MVAGNQLVHTASSPRQDLSLSLLLCVSVLQEGCFHWYRVYPRGIAD